MKARYAYAYASRSDVAHTVSYVDTWIRGYACAHEHMHMHRQRHRHTHTHVRDGAARATYTYVVRDVFACAACAACAAGNQLCTSIGARFDFFLPADARER